MLSHPSDLEHPLVRERIIIANWKMNGTLESARAWIEAYRTLPAAANCRAVLCAPFVYLPEIVERLRGTPLEVGAQDVNENPSGAYTGEISAGMLADIGVSWCIVGHSERRRYYGDTDNRVAMKALAAAKAGIRPIVCVGETLEERERGETQTVILRQLNAVLAVMTPASIGAVAYEPVWAIGTGHVADPETAQAVHASIRRRIELVDQARAMTLPILYGGSVTPDNAAGLFAMPDIDGALVGGASLKATSFFAIGQA